MMRLSSSLAVLLAAACVSGPRPVPATASPSERLALSEAAVGSLGQGTLSFVVETKGALAVQLLGTLEFRSGGGVLLTADGQLGAEAVRIELESRADGLSRSVTKGPSVANHLEPLPASLRQSFAQQLLRHGLLPALTRLSNDESIDFAPVDAQAAKVEGDAKPNEIACQRIEVRAGVSRTVLCVADATALPVEREGTVRLSVGEVTVNERYTWNVVSK